MATNDKNINDINTEDLGNGIPLTKCNDKDIPKYKIPPFTNAISDKCFDGCTKLEGILIPASVIKIGHSAFSGCTNLKSVKIEGCSTIIGENAFKGCTGLTTLATDGAEKILAEIINCKNGREVESASITIPNCMSRIDRYAFRDCTGLAVAVIGSNVKEICEGAFQGCKELNWLEIWREVTTIESMSFADCKKLKTIKIHSKMPPKSDADVFSGVPPENIRLFVPRGSKDAYSKADVWKDFTIREFDYPINNNWYPLDMEDME